MSASKRGADVPREARLLDVSKADLLEAAWELASLCNDGVDDTEATYRKLVETLNSARQRRGARPVRTKATASAPAAPAACKACEHRRSKGLAGQCPSCANDRARAELAAERASREVP